MNCPRCGTKLGSGVTFCFNCNADLRQQVASVPKPRTGAEETVAPAVDTDVVYGTPVARLCAAILDGIVIGIIYGIMTTLLNGLEDAGEDLHGVPVDIEVVIRVLLQPAERRELRQHDRQHAKLVEQVHAAQRVAPADQEPKLGELALPRRLTGAWCRGAGQRASLVLDLEAKLGCDARRAQEAQRVVVERAGRGGPQPAPGDVLAPAQRVEEL